MADQYESGVRLGTGFFSGPVKGIQSTKQGFVKRISSGEVVWATGAYYAKTAPRNLAALAGKMRKRYEYHYSVKGEGFEEQEAREREAKAKEREIEKRRLRYMRENSSLFLDLLREATNGGDVFARYMAIEADLANIATGDKID